MAIVRQFSFIPATYTPYAGELTNRTTKSYKVVGTELSSIWFGTDLKYNGAGNTVLAGTLTGFMFEKAGKVAASVEGLRVTIKSLREADSPGVVIFAGDDTFYGHAGTDYVSLANGNDTYYGAGGADFLTDWGAGRDRLYGQAGNDTIQAGADADLLDGGLHDDRLSGQSGNDTLIGGHGRDRLYGGIGSDEFVYKNQTDSVRGARRDIVQDFSREQGDKIDLSAIDANGTSTGNGAFKYIGAKPFGGTRGELRLADGILSADIDGNRVADFEIQVISALPVGKADLIL